MAVQKSRVTRSKRGMRRAHSALTNPTLSSEKVTGETHRRHHLSPGGFYRGRQVLVQKVKNQAEQEVAAGESDVS